MKGNKPLIILIHKASEMSDAEIMIFLCGGKWVIFFVRHVRLLTANLNIDSVFYSSFT